MSISASSGIVSSIDYQTIISQLLVLKRQPINQLSSARTTLNNVSSAYSTLSTKVQDIKTAADALRTESAFMVYSATVSDDTVVKATAGSTASKGTYSIVVSTLAKAHKIAAGGVAAESTVVAAGAGSFSFRVGSGTVQTVTVSATTTLANLRDSINALGAGVTASIVNDGGANPYRLVLTSGSTGTASAITITQNDTSLAFSTTLQSATDASFTVDGMAITKSSNTVTDVITGVTLDLRSEAPATTITLNVEADKAKIKDKIQNLVDKYNLMVTHIRANNRYDTETKKAGPFFGDPVARSVWEDLRKIVTGSISGLPSTMNRLIHIGITSDTEGKLSLDSSKLDSALSTNFDGVVDLFVDGSTTDGFGKLIYDAASQIDDYADGRIKHKLDGIGDNIRSIDDTIRKREQELAAYEESLRVQFTALETMLSSIKSQSSFLAGLTGGN